MYLRHATATTIKLGPYVDPTDAVTEMTLITPAVEVSKSGGAFAAASDGTMTHDADGWFDCDLDATDTGTLGTLAIKSHDAANHLPVWRYFTVLPAQVYDSLVAGSEYLETDAVLIEGVDATDAIGDAAWDEALADHAAVGSTGEALSAAGGAADPLLNPVPGAYGAGTAGYALGQVGSAGIQVYAKGSIPPGGEDFAILRGDTVTIQVTTTIAPDAARTKLVFTVKSSLNHDDDESIIQVTEGAAPGDGLKVLNGESLPTDVVAADGQITAVDEVAQTVTIVLTGDATSLLTPRGELFWDIQQLVAGDPETLERGDNAEIEGDATRSVS